MPIHSPYSHNCTIKSPIVQSFPYPPDQSPNTGQANQLAFCIDGAAVVGSGGRRPQLAIAIESHGIKYIWYLPFAAFLGVYRRRVVGSRPRRQRWLLRRLYRHRRMQRAPDHRRRWVGPLQCHTRQHMVYVSIWRMTMHSSLLSLLCGLSAPLTSAWALQMHPAPPQCSPSAGSSLPMSQAGRSMGKYCIALVCSSSSRW